MRKKIITIAVGVFLFLGAFGITSYALEEDPIDCKKVCSDTNGVGCPLLGCGIVTATNGKKYLACYYSTNATCQTYGGEEGGV